MPNVTGVYELHTHDGGHITQPSAGQLAEAIMALAAPDNRYLYVQPEPDTNWYVEVTLPDPATADVFNGPYEIHFQDNDADPARWSVYGDDPQVIATRILIWVQSMINARL
ncbi:hypothetical protein Rhe02_09570 [Rhizocola hellebori]|uniref:Uncharacterized protein n=1 Tax=Rhizocola hellebori TaxID=1392758 RepID=A0A8J3VDN9_9ACTN|nr:hypothetical protein [Rhizocola hellebori]GIH02890.1 hypothetical protein Rhe02_09570 [Rhizocola hellebori]